MANKTLILAVLVAGYTVTSVDSRSTGLFCLKNQCPQRLQELPQIDTGACAINPTCDPLSPYRTQEGFCSNLADSSWGWVSTPFVRWLSSDYADDVCEPRRSVEGLPLPPPRQLSVYNFEDHYAPSDCNVVNLMQFGQMIAHDTSENQPIIPEENCCTKDWQLLPFSQVPEGCLPIQVNPYDPFYSQFCINCLPFSRSTQAPSAMCPGQAAEQMNTVTHVLDASFVYGSDEMKALSLREMVGGRLRVQTTPDGREFPPQSPTPDTDCTNPPEETTCFYAGDDRVNQQPGVTTYQTVFLRYHNYIAGQLAMLNPLWSDETLYQEARRIVWAVFENIVYKEYLPTILGYDFVRAKGLLVDNCCDCCIDYFDESIMPSTFSEFAGAAFRSFHSQVSRELVLYNLNYQPYNVLLLDKFYNRPTVLVQPGVLDGILRGFIAQSVQNQDRCLSVALTVFLYRDYKTPYGQDLASIDIQRGRDFGLASYNSFREVCGLRKARTFADFADTISPENIRRLENSYRCVDDVDLYVGGLLEGLIPGTLVGPTFQCLIGEQFYNYMRGDRFYYENCGQQTSFTTDQRNAIYQSNLADIFCTAGDDIRSITLDTFHKPSSVNPIVPCTNIPRLDLTPWQIFSTLPIPGGPGPVVLPSPPPIEPVDQSTLPVEEVEDPSYPSSNVQLVPSPTVSEPLSTSFPSQVGSGLTTDIADIDVNSNNGTTSNLSDSTVDGETTTEISSCESETTTIIEYSDFSIILDDDDDLTNSTVVIEPFVDVTVDSPTLEVESDIEIVVNDDEANVSSDSLQIPADNSTPIIENQDVIVLDNNVTNATDPSVDSSIDSLTSSEGEDSVVMTDDSDQNNSTDSLSDSPINPDTNNTGDDTVTNVTDSTVADPSLDSSLDSPTSTQDEGSVVMTDDSDQNNSTDSLSDSPINPDTNSTGDDTVTNVTDSSTVTDPSVDSSIDSPPEGEDSVVMTDNNDQNNSTDSLSDSPVNPDNDNNMTNPTDSIDPPEDLNEIYSTSVAYASETDADDNL